MAWITSRYAVFTTAPDPTTTTHRVINLHFQERNEGEGGGILKSPGQIKHVGFGKNKVEFVDILGSSRAGSRRV